MKKALQAFFFFTVITLNSIAQVTRISENTDLGSGFPISSTKAIFISSTTGKLYVTDATLPGTSEIASPVIYDESGAVAVMNNKLYFSGKTAGAGSELWVSDGTAGGTQLVKDINPGTPDSKPTAMVSLNGKLYFYANTPTYGQELWISDGTESGTNLLKDIYTGTTGSYDIREEMAIVNNQLFFSARSAANGQELWKTNGTEAGTVQVKDINPGAGHSGPVILTQINNTLYFSADNGTIGNELWKTNGTEVGTELVKDIFSGPTGSSITKAVNLNGKLLLNARSSIGNSELWVSDGTEGGTVLVKEIFTGPVGSDPDLEGGIIMNNKLIFPATSDAWGRELFITDGTTGGTTLFVDIQAGLQGSNPTIWQDRNILSGNGDPLRSLWNGKIFVQTSLGNFPLTTSALWIIDGTPGNITFIKDFGLMGLLGSWFYTQSGLYFSATDADHGYELWKSVGTTATTALFADINPGTESSYPFIQFFILNGKIFISADDGIRPDDERDLFVIDGLEIPLPLKIISFNGASKTNGVELAWVTANENNVKEIIVERSSNGKDFTAIANVAPKGASGKNNYSYNDPSAWSVGGNLYYRLQVVDNDGKVAYSLILMIKPGKPANYTINAAPNPARDMIRINFVAPAAGKAEMMIVNASGQVMEKLNLMVQEGANQQVLNLSSKAPGTYVVVLKNGSDTIGTVRFIKQ